ncbi:stage III sporulation protein SpoIIIAB [Paenibacillus protaetiae]|uniref:Stage III sporulation protein AB n=1 Tax=Paenibacillus protaetiae TaxID=2509456 RepID=A0A4P6F034_9BACL|nr:stage III sporulation protein SpoIIIAB [Paenibacillus protaetiae]QAY68405.1 stage III sporulation protein AB [Paenibacillus protaetiae]
MIKLLGAMLVLAAGTLIGFLMAGKYAARPRELRQMAYALKRLETEIGYGRTPLPIALLRTGEAASPPVSDIFKAAAEELRREDGPTFQESWTAAVNRVWAYTAMRSVEQGIVLRLGSALGISDKDDQLKHLKLALVQLKAEEDEARDEQARYEKMWKSLGVLAAALVVIVMI